MVPKRSIPCRPPPMMRINIMVGRTLPCWRTDSRRTRCSLHSRARASISMQSRSSWRKYGSCPSRSPSIIYWPLSATKLPCCSDAACAPQDKSLRSALARRAVRCTARFYVHMHRASRYIAHMMSWTLVDEAIGAATGVPFRAHVRRPVGGGCINQAFVIEDAAIRYFVKLNRAEAGEMFAAEADGLAAILASRAIRVPRPVCWGSVGDDAYLVLEHLSFGGTRADGMQRLGAGLAALHRRAIWLASRQHHRHHTPVQRDQRRLGDVLARASFALSIAMCGGTRMRSSIMAKGRAPAREGRCIIARTCARALVAARRFVVGQLRDIGKRRARHLRSGCVLRRSRDGSRHDRIIRWLLARVLRGLSRALSACRRLSVAKNSLQSLSRAES